MKVINIHKRIIDRPISEIGQLLHTLATDNYQIIATDKWPKMKLDNGLQIGSKGGHGPIRYFIADLELNKFVKFQFDMKGFEGFHKFEIMELGTEKTEIVHLIDMETSGIATMKWLFAFRWLHDAFIEDAFDKVENRFRKDQKLSVWSLWVRLLRKVMKPKRKAKAHN